MHCWTKLRYLNFWIFSQQLTTTTQDSGEESGCFTEGKFKKRSPVTGLLGGEKRWIVKGGAKQQRARNWGGGNGSGAALLLALWCKWNYFSFKISHRFWLAPIPEQALCILSALTIFGRCRQYTIDLKVQLPLDWIRTPTRPPLYCFGTPIWPPWCHVKTLY